MTYYNELHIKKQVAHYRAALVPKKPFQNTITDITNDAADTALLRDSLPRESLPPMALTYAMINDWRIDDTAAISLHVKTRCSLQLKQFGGLLENCNYHVGIHNETKS